MISEGQFPYSGYSTQSDYDALPEPSFKDVGLQSAGQSATFLPDYSLRTRLLPETGPPANQPKISGRTWRRTPPGSGIAAPKNNYPTRMDMGQDPDLGQAGE